jgi:hypothetical protein
VGRALALSLAGLVPLFARADTPARPDRPAPRSPIGGIASIDCASTVTYASALDTPHRLNATYAFPDRVRWWLGVGDESSPERQMRLRFGDALYAVDKHGGASRELLAEERAEALVQLEMRRALLLWPLGFDWKREGLASHAAITRIGRLTARFAEAASTLPNTLEFTAEDGRPGDVFRSITWRIEKDKPWPVALELWHERSKVWTETIRSIDVKTRFIDSYFLPPDRREGAVSNPLEIGGVRGTDLPECRVQRVGLKEGATLEQAFDEWKRVVESRSKDLAAVGFALEDKVTLEVDREARPRALLLRLAPAKSALPEALSKSFEAWPERPGLTTFVMGLEAVSAAPLAALLGALPADAVAGAPYLRFDPKRPGEHVLIVLPLLPGGK